MEGQAPQPRRGPLDRPDPASLRISDDDRHQVAEVLRKAAGEGRIDLDELEERLEATYRARTYGELVPITVDLPTSPPARARAAAAQIWEPSPDAAGPHFTGSIAVLSETKRTGSWIVQNGHSAFALMGSVVLDLREALFERAEVVINASSVMGEVQIIVGAGTSVVVEGVGVMGEFTEQRPKVPFDAEQGGPVVRVRGLALMGSVTVQRRGRPGEGIRKRIGWSGH